MPQRRLERPSTAFTLIGLPQLESREMPHKSYEGDLLYSELRAPICCLSSVGYPPNAQSILNMASKYLPASRGWSYTIAPRTHAAPHHIRPSTLKFGDPDEPI